jgi:hypothetical protein
MSENINNKILENRKIVVVGSSNTDLIVKSNQFPTPGSTVSGIVFCVCKI